MLRGKRSWEEVAEVSLRRDNNARAVEATREERVMTGKGEWTEITSDFIGKGRVRERAARRREGKQLGSVEGEFIVTQCASLLRR